MTGAQLYLMISLPTIVELAGILMNVGCFIALIGRMRRIEDKLDRFTHSP